MTFFAIGIGALITLLCLIKLLPLLPSEHSGSLKSLPAIVPPPGIDEHLFVNCGGCHRPLHGIQLYRAFCTKHCGIQRQLCHGITVITRGAGIIGSVIFGKLGNQYASALVSTAIALLLVCLALLLPAANSEIHLGMLSIFWGSR